MKRLLILSSVVAFVATAFMTTSGQRQNVPPIAKAVYWATADAEVYLFEHGSGGFRLTVISRKRFTVTYHTRINSIEPVDKVLSPTNSANGVTTYDFDHNFSKMTIWMALEFSFDGKTMPELTRTFLNDINEVVANGYFNSLSKPRP